MNPSPRGIYPKPTFEKRPIWADRINPISPSTDRLGEIRDILWEIRDKIYLIEPSGNQYSHNDFLFKQHKSIGLLEIKNTSATREPITKIRFDELASKWRAETRYSSTMLTIAINPFYQQIIGMGPVAIPYILSELARHPDHWFWALKAITGEDPVSDEDRGDLDKMTSAWLEWGARNGYSI